MSLIARLTTLEEKHNINGFFTTEEEARIDVRIPLRYILPEKLENIPGHELLDPQEALYEKIEELFTNQIRVSSLNNVETCGFMYSYTCDHCPEIGSWMHFCTICQRHMCQKCYLERTEEIALQHGAKQWQERKVSLWQCFEHETKTPFTVAIRGVICDGCGVASDEARGMWKCNRQKDQDFCPACQDAAPEGTWTMSDQNLYKFGSFCDWLPILADDVGDTVLYNGNPDSPFYQKLALGAIDDHGREGYAIIPETITTLWTKLRENVATYQKLKDDKGWTAHYNTPIKQVMVEHDNQVHFG